MILTPIISDFIIGEELSSEMDELSKFSLYDQQTPSYLAREAEVNAKLVPKLPILLPVVFIILMFFFLLTSVAIFNYMKEEKFNSAFQFKDIFRTAFSSIYVLTCLLFVVMMIPTIIAIGFILFLLAFSTIGLIFVPIISVICSYIILIISHSLLGQAYAEA